MSEEYDEVIVVKTKKAKKSKRVKEEPEEKEPQKKHVKFEDNGAEVAATSTPVKVKEEEEEQVVTRIRSEEDKKEGQKERERIKLSEKDQLRKNTSRSNLGNLKVGNVSYEEALLLWKMYPQRGFEVIKEKRHVALSYHLLNSSSIQKSIQFIATSQIGKFRSKVQGIVVAVGPIKQVGMPRVVDDQNVFHLNCEIDQVVFRPNKNAVYEAKVTHIGHTFLSALVFNAITCNVTIDEKFDSKQKGMEVKLNDIVSVKYKHSTVKRGEIRLNGTFEGIVKKGDPNESGNADGGDYKVDVKKEKPTAKKLNTTISFHDSDDSDSE